MLGFINVYDGLPSNVKDAIYAIASSLNDISLINSIADDYSNNDPATVTQVNYYISKQNSTGTILQFGIYALGAYLFYKFINKAVSK